MGKVKRHQCQRSNLKIRGWVKSYITYERSKGVYYGGRTNSASIHRKYTIIVPIPVQVVVSGDKKEDCFDCLLVGPTTFCVYDHNKDALECFSRRRDNSPSLLQIRGFCAPARFLHMEKVWTNPPLIFNISYLNLHTTRTLHECLHIRWTLK